MLDYLFFSSSAAVNSPADSIMTLSSSDLTFPSFIVINAFFVLKFTITLITPSCFSKAFLIALVQVDAQVIPSTVNVIFISFSTGFSIGFSIRFNANESLSPVSPIAQILPSGSANSV